jgi:hypothetical protein
VWHELRKFGNLEDDGSKVERADMPPFLEGLISVKRRRWVIQYGEVK